MFAAFNAPAFAFQTSKCELIHCGVGQRTRKGAPRDGHSYGDLLGVERNPRIENFFVTVCPGGCRIVTSDQGVVHWPAEHGFDQRLSAQQHSFHQRNVDGRAETDLSLYNDAPMARITFDLHPKPWRANVAVAGHDVEAGP